MTYIPTPPDVTPSKVTASGGSSSTALSSRFSFLLNLQTDFGAVGNNSTDDTTAWQNAITAVQALGQGCTLYVPKPSVAYKITATLTVTKPIRIMAEGYEADTTAASGVSLAGACLSWAGGASPMMIVKSSTASSRLWGVEILGLKFVGNNTATHGLLASSISRCKIDISVATVVTAGLLIDDGNSALSQFNNIPRYQFVYGSQAAVQGASGIILDGTSGIGVTQTLIGQVSGLVYNGNMIQLGDCDNNHIQHCHASIQSGGSGYSVYLGNGGAHPARNNVFDYVTGAVFTGSAAYGNTILHYNTEAGGITGVSGSKINYRAIGYTDGARYETPFFYMSDELFVPASMLVPAASSGATRGDAASLWPGAVVFPDAATSGAGFTMGPPALWAAGAITGMRLYFTTDSANTSKSVMLRFRIKHAGPNADIQTASLDESYAVAVSDVAYRYTVLTRSVTTYNFGIQDFQAFRIDRIGADVGDTASGNFILLGIGIRMTSAGPTAGGSGPFFSPGTK